jgi:hypothetical protein
MADRTTRTLSYSCWEDLVAAINAIGSELPLDIRKRFNKVFKAYWQRYGFEGAFQRLNNRTVAEILAEYDPRDDPTPIASGELEGLRYELYEAPGANKEDE